MNPLSYLDIHTHRRSPIGSGENLATTVVATTVVANLSMLEIQSEKSDHEFISAGIHPWWLEESTPEEIEALKVQIEKMARGGLLWGIGETGFDRSYPEFLEQQKTLFDWHMNLAESLQLPLVIHNVRSGSDFLEVLKRVKPTVPWIFHDFRGNEELVKSLLNLHPGCFFSFGLSIDNSPQIRELLPLIPLENFFLETDGQKHLDIHEIYLRAADHLKIDLEFLKAQIWHNFRKLTPKLH